MKDPETFLRFMKILKDQEQRNCKECKGKGWYERSTRYGRLEKIECKHGWSTNIEITTGDLPCRHITKFDIR